MTPLRIPFRIRQVYYDKIVAGEKDNEVRRASNYWLWVKAQAIQTWERHEDVVAVFIRGGTNEVHRREILTIENHESAFQALGREPSEQGKKDLGDGPVLKFILGEELSHRQTFSPEEMSGSNYYTGKNGRRCHDCGRQHGRHTLTCPLFKTGGGYKAGGHLPQ